MSGPRSGSATSRQGSCTRSTATYVERGTPLADGDEVALIPPVSGGAYPALRRAALARGRRRRGGLRRRRRDRDVRRHDAGALARPRRVRLEYEAYEGMAEAEMERIADVLRERHDVIDVAIHHRVGPVEIGETSVVIAVSAAHRAAAFDACRERDRHPQADGAALEEGALRRRRGVDRQRGRVPGRAAVANHTAGRGSPAPSARRAVTRRSPRITDPPPPPTAAAECSAEVLASMM